MSMAKFARALGLVLVLALVLVFGSKLADMASMNPEHPASSHSAVADPPSHGEMGKAVGHDYAGRLWDEESTLHETSKAANAALHETSKAANAALQKAIGALDASELKLRETVHAHGIHGVANSQAPPAKLDSRPCSACNHQGAGHWWNSTGLNCPKGTPPGSCDICTSTNNAAVCDTATTPQACCNLCKRWNDNRLPGVASPEEKLCRSWYFNHKNFRCVLKDCGSYAECQGVKVSNEFMTSGPGCSVDCTPLAERQTVCQCHDSTIGSKSSKSSSSTNLDQPEWQCLRGSTALTRRDLAVMHRIGRCQQYADNPAGVPPPFEIDPELPDLCGTCPQEVGNCISKGCCHTVPVLSRVPVALIVCSYEDSTNIMPS
jgi:hypothetical protein